MTVFIGGERLKSAVSHLKRNNIPNFANPDSAVEALDKYYKWNVFRKRKSSQTPEKESTERKKQVAEIIAKARGQKRVALLFPEAAAIMELYGINCVKSYAILPGQPVPEVAEYPVAVKIDSDKVLHKDGQAGVDTEYKRPRGFACGRCETAGKFSGTAAGSAADAGKTGRSDHGHKERRRFSVP